MPRKARMRSLATSVSRMFKHLRGARRAQAEWSVMSALRGPDGEQLTVLKHRTTSRIRYAIGVDPSLGIAINETRPHYVDSQSFNPTFTALRTLFPEADIHFLSHYLAACFELTPVMDSLPEPRWTTILEDALFYIQQFYGEEFYDKARSFLRSKNIYY